MTTFAEVSKQVHLIDDLILAEMISGKNDYYEESVDFSKHLLTTKYWYTRISWKNKKDFLLTLLEDVTSVWTLSLLLKSIWNCRPKDAVSSISEKPMWTSYDQVPLDNNRTVLPNSMLLETMANGRAWFSTLETDQQALVLLELLTVSGGPIMWEMLSRAQQIYETHREQEIEEMLDCVILTEPAADKKAAATELEISLATWNAAVKSIRDSFKLEELEMTYKDGSTRTIWKVNRVKPESIETVDFLQLLPSAIAKRILLYIPQTQYGEISKVNKYWAFLTDEIKAETLARQKINTDIDRLQEIILRREQELELATGSEINTKTSKASAATSSYTTSSSKEVAKKSTCSILWRKIVIKPPATTFEAVKKMADLFERLDRRGAADENIWTWCCNILKLRKHVFGRDVKKKYEGILPLGDFNFPCPLLAHSLDVPLAYPLIVDPTLKNPTKALEKKRSSWKYKDVSVLYPVIKIPSYQFPY